MSVLAFRAENRWVFNKKRLGVEMPRPIEK